MWTKPQLAYLAGIIDGEGTFYIGVAGPTKRKFISRISVVNTFEPLVIHLQNVFGGLVYSRKSRLHPKWKTKYEWILTGHLCTSICNLVLPFLICKKEQAKLMLKFRTSFSPNKSPTITKEILDFRKSCKEKMNHLNNP